MLPIKNTLFLLVFCLILGCQHKAKNRELVFETYQPTTKEYKNKLAEKIKENPKDIIYYFKRCFQQNKKDYIEIEVNGSDFDANGFVLLNNWNKLEALKKNNGKGYNGAVLDGLQLEVKLNPEGAILIYKDLEKIID